MSTLLISSLYLHYDKAVDKGVLGGAEAHQNFCSSPMNNRTIFINSTPKILNLSSLVTYVVSEVFR